jgi:hypothetical protein
MTKDQLLDQIDSLRVAIQSAPFSLFDNCSAGERFAFKKIAETLRTELDRLIQQTMEF